MGGPGQLMPAPVATAGVKEESRGKSLESRKRKSKLGSLDSLEQVRAVLESAEPDPRLTGSSGSQWVR